MSSFYVDPFAIAKSEGILVIPRYDLDVNGLIKKDSINGNIVIEYDASMHQNRERFTIAHELGHYFAGHLEDGHTLFRDPSKNFNLHNYDPYEAEANKLAAEMLMPKEKIDFLIQKANYHTIDDIADALRVSPAAMTYRLKNLGYIS